MGPARPLGASIVDADVGGEPLTVRGTVRRHAGNRRAGPDGEMLTGLRGRHPTCAGSGLRPAHLVGHQSTAGHEPVTTHVFDRASDYLDSDAVFGVRPSLIVDMEGGEARFDPVLAPLG